MSHETTSSLSMRVMGKLEMQARAYSSPTMARAAKRLILRPRYMIQERACRQGFRQYGDQYPQQTLFVAGLPKSGTTWLEQMLLSYPGYSLIRITEGMKAELVTGKPHDFDLPRDTFSRFNKMLVLTKMHIPGSPHNAAVLGKSGVRYVVLYRDLRDVAVSYVFFVQSTPWHRLYPLYRDLTIAEGLDTFAQETLLEFKDWIQSWQQNRDPKLSLEIRYEQMLADTHAVFTNVAQHFQLDSSPQIIDTIIEQARLEKLKKKRLLGFQGNFFRKGVSGDWRTHFTPKLKDIYKERIGDFLIDLGYETGMSW